MPSRCRADRRAGRWSTSAAAAHREIDHSRVVAHDPAALDDLALGRGVAALDRHGFVAGAGRRLVVLVGLARARAGVRDLQEAFKLGLGVDRLGEGHRQRQAVAELARLAVQRGEGICLADRRGRRQRRLGVAGCRLRRGELPAGEDVAAGEDAAGGPASDGVRPCPTTSPRRRRRPRLLRRRSPARTCCSFHSRQTSPFARLQRSFAAELPTCMTPRASHCAARVFIDRKTRRRHHWRRLVPA